jgi:transketolase C-terminal domain/subunit
LFEQEANIETKQLIPINTTSRGGLHYIHSGTYTELAAHYGMSAEKLADKILNTLKSK